MLVILIFILAIISTIAIVFLHKTESENEAICTTATIICIGSWTALSGFIAIIFSNMSSYTIEKDTLMQDYYEINYQLEHCSDLYDPFTRKCIYERAQEYNEKVSKGKRDLKNIWISNLIPDYYWDLELIDFSNESEPIIIYIPKGDSSNG